MADVDRIARQAQDAIDAIQATVTRARTAHTTAKGANRQANRLGTRIAGNGTDNPPYPDPAGTEAIDLIETLNTVEIALSDIKQHAYATAAKLAEFAPNRTGYHGRRCGENDCSRPHYARNRCEPHYRTLIRAEQRTAAIQARNQDASYPDARET